LGASISIVSQGNNRRRNIQLLSYIAPLVMYTTRLLAPVGCLQYITYCYNTTGFIHFFFHFFKWMWGEGASPQLAPRLCTWWKEEREREKRDILIASDAIMRAHWSGAPSQPPGKTTKCAPSYRLHHMMDKKGTATI
jgi:hypothetical protein